jgi:hypothetical protein
VTAFTQLSLNEKVRGEDIDIDTWLLLSKALESCPHETTL